jgi:acyl-CoA synthetase (AMP-forming)/AMP-acid ligase II
MIEGYGITECGPILTLNPPGRKRRGVGIALPSVKLLIVHPETLEILGTNKEGHILASGPGIFRGYLDPNLPSPFIVISGEKWYKTGDLGFLDEEGYLTLVGRLKRFIKIGGEMISLGAIEEALYEKGKSKGWDFKPDEPAFAVCALESDKKAEIWLFTDFALVLEEANRVLKESGMSNLIRLSKVVELPHIPLLGTGKIDYHALNLRMKDGTNT